MNVYILKNQKRKPLTWKRSFVPVSLDKRNLFPCCLLSANSNSVIAEPASQYTAALYVKWTMSMWSVCYFCYVVLSSSVHSLWHNTELLYCEYGEENCSECINVKFKLKCLPSHLLGFTSIQLLLLRQCALCELIFSGNTLWLSINKIAE